MDIRLQKVINFFKEDAPTMSMSGGGIAGSAEAGDDPPCLLYTSDAADD